MKVLSRLKTVAEEFEEPAVIETLARHKTYGYYWLMFDGDTYYIACQEYGKDSKELGQGKKPEEAIKNYVNQSVSEFEDFEDFDWFYKEFSFNKGKYANILNKLLTDAYKKMEAEKE